MRHRRLTTWILMAALATVLTGCSVWNSLPLVGDSYRGGTGQTPSGLGYSEPD